MQTERFLLPSPLPTLPRHPKPSDHPQWLLRRQALPHQWPTSPCPPALTVKHTFCPLGTTLDFPSSPNKPNHPGVLRCRPGLYSLLLSGKIRAFAAEASGTECLIRSKWPRALADGGAGTGHLHFPGARAEPAERLGHLLRVIGRLVEEDPDVLIHQHPDGQAEEVLRLGRVQDRWGGQQKALDIPAQLPHPRPPCCARLSPLMCSLPDNK